MSRFHVGRKQRFASCTFFEFAIEINMFLANSFDFSAIILTTMIVYYTYQRATMSGLAARLTEKPYYTYKMLNRRRKKERMKKRTIDRKSYNIRSHSQLKLVKEFYEMLAQTNLSEFPGNSAISSVNF